MIRIPQHPEKIKPKSPIWHALALAARGVAVFPMSRAKTPLAGSHGVQDASTEPSRLHDLFADPRAELVAIATGEPSGISVMDIDRQHNGLTWWEENRRRLPVTWAWRSRSGGLHVAMKHRPELRTIAIGKIGQGVEIRSTGSSAIYWPGAGLPVLCEASPADWPDWLLPPPKPAWTPAPAQAWQGDDRAARRYALAAMRRGIEAVAGAAPGTRNAALNRECYSLLRLTETGAIHAGEIAEAMAHAGIAAGLDRSEIEATLRSALGARAGQ
ncbi:MAG TPA: bifunctional DNA primase/polymerase [Acidiphilium sp.]|nr:bifunctional DNA primase/polymerase [Acidiphilium sp.]